MIEFSLFKHKKLSSTKEFSYCTSCTSQLCPADKWYAFHHFLKVVWNAENVFMISLEKMSQNSNSKNFTGIFLKLQWKILYLCTNSKKKKHHDYRLLKLVSSTVMWSMNMRIWMTNFLNAKNIMFNIPYNSNDSINIMADKYHSLNLFRLHSTLSKLLELIQPGIILGNGSFDSWLEKVFTKYNLSYFKR